MLKPNNLQRFTQILVLGNVAIMAILILTVALALQASRQTYVGRAQQTAENLARTLSLGISAEIRQIDNALLSTAEQINRLEEIGKLTPVQLANIAKEQKAHVPQVDALRVTDANGVVLNGETTSPISIADRDYFKQVREKPGQLLISEPVQGRIIKKWGFILARARLADDGRFLGAVYSNLSSEHLVDLFDDFSLGPQDAISLRSDSLQLIARLSSEDKSSVAGIGTTNVSAELKAALAAQPNGGFFIAKTALDGIERASAYQRVPGFPLVVLVGLGTDDFYAPWRSESLKLTAMAALLACLVLGLSVIFYKRQVIQLKTQVEIARLATEREALLQSGLVGMAKLKSRITVWHNQALCDIFGYGSNELLGRNSRILYSDESAYEQVGRAYAGLTAGGAYRGQVQMVRKDGSLIWIDLSGSTLGNGESLWMMVDITAVKESEHRHRTIVEDQSELISLASEDGILIYINPAYARQFNAAPVALLGKNLFDYINPVDRDAVRAQITQVFATGQVIKSENRMVDPNGGEIWIAWHNSVQIGPDGQRQLHSVGRDITRRIITEKALRASQDFLARTGKLAGVGGWEVDLVNQTIAWSEEVRHIHEVPPGYVPNMEEAIAFYPAQAQDTLREAMRLAIELRQAFDLELPLITAQGRNISVRAVGEAEFDSNGNAFRLIGAFQDITARKALEVELRQLTELIDNTPDYVVQMDWQGQVHYLNRAARKVLGFAPQEAVSSHSFTEFNTPETNARFATEITPAVKLHGTWLGENTIRPAHGISLPVSHLVIGHRDEQGRIARYSAVMRDISAEVQARKDLDAQSSTLRAVVETIPAMVSVLDRDFRYRMVNRAFERWRGKDRNSMIGHTVLELFGQAEYERSLPWAQRALAGETIQFEKDYPNATHNRHMSFSYVPLRLEDGSIDGMIGIAQDISHHRTEQKRLLDLSERDALTGLLNRAGFTSFLTRECEGSGAANLALLYIDLDRFKPVNDSYGHPVGDEVLQQFALRLLKLVRPTDAVARLGGDEFAVVLTSVRERDNAEAVADKVVEAALAPFYVGNLQIYIGASVGVAFGADDQAGWKGLVERADAKVYAAKAAGRGRKA